MHGAGDAKTMRAAILCLHACGAVTVCVPVHDPAQRCSVDLRINWAKPFRQAILVSM